MSERTAVYHIYNDRDQLLYVGVAKRFGRRWEQHAKAQPWWSEVDHLTVRWYPTREDALLAEKRAIHEEGPAYNVKDSPWMLVKDDETGFFVVPKPPKPETGDTPRRSIRVPDAEWDAAKAVADEHGETLSDVIRAGLRRYVARNAKRARNGQTD